MSAVWTWLKEENADSSWTDWFSEQGFETALTVAIDFLLTALLEVIIGLMNSFHTDCLTLSMGVKGSITTHFYINVQRKQERDTAKPSNTPIQKLNGTTRLISKISFNKVVTVTDITLTSLLFVMFSSFAGSFWVAGGVWGFTLTFWPTFLPTIRGAGRALADILDLALAGCLAGMGIPLATAIGLALCTVLATALTSTAGFWVGWRLLLEMDMCRSW